MGKSAERSLILYDPLEPGRTWLLTGSADDEGILGALEKSSGMFEVRLVKALSSLLPDDGVVLDVGANIGPITLPLAARCPSGVVHAFEPVASTRRFLERNTSVVPNVKVHGIGLGDFNGSRTIHVHPRHPGGAHTGGEAEEGENTERIEIMTLDAWAAANNIERIDMIKVDIEGDELAFLAGAAQTLRRFRPVLAVECNPVPLWRFAGVGPSVLIERLAAVYGGVGWIEEDGTIRRLAGTEQALFELTHHALIDLICGAPFAAEPTPLTMPQADAAKKVPPRPHFFKRWLRGGIRTLAQPLSKGPEVKPAPPPEFTFVHSPSYRATFEINKLYIAPGSCLRLPVRLHNTSSFWYWSHWPNPVTASYRWRRSGRVVVKDGMRTLLHDAIAPGAQAIINLAVAVPDEPGEYELVFSLVQEGYAWFEQLRSELGIVLPASVR
jgi:FkbM family methyltransferase